MNKTNTGYEKAINIIMEASKNRPVVGCCQQTTVIPTLTIGTVTTGAPGTEAAASITGTAPNFILNLTIPQGPVGPAA